MEKKVIKESKIAEDVTKKKKTVSKEKKATSSRKSNIEDIKKAVPEAEPFSVKFKKFIASYAFLYSLFAVLLVVVIILAIMLGKKENEQDVNKSDIVFSVLEKNTNNSFNVNLKGLIERKYVLKVSNFRNDTLCEEDIPYKIHIINTSSAEIEILKDGGVDNLMVDQKETIIEAPALGCAKKTETLYYFKLLNYSKIKDDDVLKIEVIS